MKQNQSRFPRICISVPPGVGGEQPLVRRVRGGLYRCDGGCRSETATTRPPARRGGGKKRMGREEEQDGVRAYSVTRLRFRWRGVQEAWLTRQLSRSTSKWHLTQLCVEGWKGHTPTPRSISTDRISIFRAFFGYTYINLNLRLFEPCLDVWFVSIHVY